MDNHVDDHDVVYVDDHDVDIDDIGHGVVYVDN